MRARSKRPLVLKEAEPEAELAPVLEAEPEASALPEPVVEEAPPAPSATTLPAASTPTRPDGGARAAYPLAIVAALLWVGGVASYTAYQVGGGQIEATPVNLALLGLVALAPAGLVLVVAHLLRQAAALAGEARRARDMVDALVLPTGVAVRESGQALISLRDDIDLSTAAADRARSEIAALRAAMEEETTRLNEAADLAQRTARRLADQLAKERLELTDLGKRLEGQTNDVIETVERQARMVADASDLAQTQLREAEATLAARAADMASAAAEAQDAARSAADDLARQTMRLETAGSGVADQIRSVEEGLSEQRAALVQAGFGLRQDQEDFSAQVETQRAQLADVLARANVASGEVSDISNRSAETLQTLVEAAADQIKALSDLADGESKRFDTRTREALDQYEDLAAQARQAALEESERTLAVLEQTLAETRSSADAAIVEARERVERLSEAIFAAGQTADQTAEARLMAARRVVEETAGLGEAASQKIAEHLTDSLTQTRAALADIDAALAELDERSARLPADSRAHIEGIRKAVEDSLQSVTDAARRASEETAAADAAFHERVKRNYDMLTEAVRLMGVVSGDGPGGQPRRDSPRSAPPEDDAGLRGRLRLTPTHTDEEVRRTFQPAPIPEPDRDRVSWRDLLANTGEPSLDADADADAPGEDADAGDLAGRVSAAILDLGVDPAALLPRARVEEAADALHVGDPDRSRQIVRRVAPAAVRRISRRVLTDRALRQDVERFVRHYARALDAASRNGARSETSQLLGSDAGRAFLLLDAAIGDLS